MIYFMFSQLEKAKLVNKYLLIEIDDRRFKKTASSSFLTTEVGRSVSAENGFYCVLQNRRAIKAATPTQQCPVVISIFPGKTV